MNAAGTAAASSALSRFTSRSTVARDPSERCRSKASRTGEPFFPASTTSSSSALSTLTGAPSTFTSSSPGRMSERAAPVPGATPTTTGAPPRNRNTIGTGTSLPSRRSFSFASIRG
ncbi:MAG TPA: hypothetical protein VGQ17_04680 [Gemmatimonadales bacterium]|nr:hypothetical protein [Gemmatimonadales bacterium]